MPTLSPPALPATRFLEILVAIALVTMGLLGALHWLHASQASSAARYQRAEAVQQAAAMHKRLQADRQGALAGDYDGQQMPTACARPGGSDRLPQAQYRLCLWQLGLAQTLSDGQAMVQTADGRTHITVSWRALPGRPGRESHTLTVQP